jgi:hypothetical protein
MVGDKPRGESTDADSARRGTVKVFSGELVADPCRIIFYKHDGVHFRKASKRPLISILKLK